VSRPVRSPRFVVLVPRQSRSWSSAPWPLGSPTSNGNRSWYPISGHVPLPLFSPLLLRSLLPLLSDSTTEMRATGSGPGSGPVRNVSRPLFAYTREPPRARDVSTDAHPPGDSHGPAERVVMHRARASAPCSPPDMLIAPAIKRRASARGRDPIASPICSLDTRDTMGVGEGARGSPSIASRGIASSRELSCPLACNYCYYYYYYYYYY